MGGKTESLARSSCFEFCADEDTHRMHDRDTQDYCMLADTLGSQSCVI